MAGGGVLIKDGMGKETEEMRKGERKEKEGRDKGKRHTHISFPKLSPMTVALSNHDRFLYSCHRCNQK